MPRVVNMQARLGCQEGVTATWEAVEQRAPRASGQGSAGLRKGGNGREISTSVDDGAGGANDLTTTGHVVGPWLAASVAAVQ